jgi:hypothetical protein
MAVLGSLGASTLLLGCATAYQPHGLTGGFEESQVNQNTFRVAFRGNGYTSTNRVEELTLLRSAEICLDRGLPGFVLLRERTDIRNESLWMSSATVSGRHAYAAGGNFLFSMPSTSNLVSCIDEKAPNVFSYDALILYESLTTKYQVPRSAKFADWKSNLSSVRVSAAPSAQQASKSPGQWLAKASGIARHVGCSAEPASASLTAFGAERYEFACRMKPVLRIECLSTHGGCHIQKQDE